VSRHGLIVCNVADAAQRDEYLGRRAPLDRTDGLLIVSLSPGDEIFAASDTQALGVLEAAGFEGVAVPDDLSVVGFDDVEVAPYVGLTTVRQPLRDSGRRGVERLVASVRGEDDGPLEEALELKLVVRRTTEPLR
jgi:LacI family transcriptional regulator